MSSNLQYLNYCHHLCGFRQTFQTVVATFYVSTLVIFCVGKYCSVARVWLHRCEFDSFSRIAPSLASQIINVLNYFGKLEL